MLPLRPSGELNSANLGRTLDSDRITGRTLDFLCFQIVYLDLHCMLGFNWIWNSEEGFRLLFVCLFYLLCFVWKALGQRGSVD